MPKSKFDLRRRGYYPYLFLLGLVLLVGLIIALPNVDLKGETLLASIAAIAGLVHFLYQQHNSNTDRFVHLFESFNKRYDRLNSRLNSIARQGHSETLTAEENDILFDYFNLCAEEYIFYEAGYIDTRVWLAWTSGMKHFFSNPRINGLWEQERKQNSYYGFVPPGAA